MKYDVLVIGGGIHGVGVAQAAAARGYSVALLEQQGLASGTSSRSSKLIHGGLRYLESWQLSLVRECLSERAILLKIAPHLVRLVSFYIPVYTNTSRRPWLIRTGLSLYSLLGGRDKDNRYTTVDKDRWGQLDGLNTQGLQAVFEYKDGQTDDRLLTRAVMASAQSLGADLLMPAQFQSARFNGQAWEFEYQYQDKPRACEARTIVNAAGPWANEVLSKMSPVMAGFPVSLVQGSHIVVDTVVEQGVYYMESPIDQRAVFAIPWNGKTMVGTTETDFTGSLNQVHILPKEQSYLQTTFAHYFPGHESSTVVESFAGLRVLPGADGKAFHKSRDTCLYVDNENRPTAVHIFGGKLTAYRATAQRVMDRLALTLPEKKTLALTSELILPEP